MSQSPDLTKFQALYLLDHNRGNHITPLYSLDQVQAEVEKRVTGGADIHQFSVLRGMETPVTFEWESRVVLRVDASSTACQPKDDSVDLSLIHEEDFQKDVYHAEQVHAQDEVDWNAWRVADFENASLPEDLR